jgi:hypothetical protein
MDTKNLGERASRIKLSHRAWAQLVSRDGSGKVHQAELSGWLGGSTTLRESKVQRVVAALEKVEALVANSPIRVDLRDAQNIERALEMLPALMEKQRAAIIESTSTAPPAQFAVSKPVWPAKSRQGDKPSDAASLLAEVQQ